MEFNSYQGKTAKTAIYPNDTQMLAVTYTALGLANEAGEVAGKIKKAMRDDNMEITNEKREQLVGELGDVLWYLARLADELNVDLDLVAEYNLDKLFSRAERGVIGGDGDNR